MNSPLKFTFIKPTETLCIASVHPNNHANLISNLPLFNLAVAGSSVQSISASDLLKQQKEQLQQRMLARKKRAEEIQKRWEVFVLINGALTTDCICFALHLEADTLFSISLLSFWGDL